MGPNRVSAPLRRSLKHVQAFTEHQTRKVQLKRSVTPPPAILMPRSHLTTAALSEIPKPRPRRRGLVEA